MFSIRTLIDRKSICEKSALFGERDTCRKRRGRGGGGKHRAFRISLGSVSVIVGRVRYVFRRNTGFRSTIGQPGTRNGQWIEQNQLNCTLFPVGGFPSKWCGSADSRPAYRARSRSRGSVAPRRAKIVLTTYVPSRRFAKWCGSLRGQTRRARACNPGYRLMPFISFHIRARELSSRFIPTISLSLSLSLSLFFSRISLSFSFDVRVWAWILHVT